jgi:hypothetical protein
MHCALALCGDKNYYGNEQVIATLKRVKFNQNWPEYATFLIIDEGKIVMWCLESNIIL